MSGTTIENLRRGIGHYLELGDHPAVAAAEDLMKEAAERIADLEAQLSQTPPTSDLGHAAAVHRAAAQLANATNLARRAGLSVEVEICNLGTDTGKQSLFLPRVSREIPPKKQEQET